MLLEERLHRVLALERRRGAVGGWFQRDGVYNVHDVGALCAPGNS